jgi:hypothetical protein
MAFIAGKGFAILNSKAEKGDQKAKDLLAKLNSIDQDEADRLFSEILGKGGGGGAKKEKKIKAPGASATDGQGEITEGAGEQAPTGKATPKAKGEAPVAAPAEPTGEVKPKSKKQMREMVEGVTQQLSKLESSGRKINDAGLQKLADKFGTTTDGILDIASRNGIDLESIYKETRQPKGKVTQKESKPADPLSNDNLKNTFDKYEGNVDSVLDDLREQQIDISNNDLQDIVEGFAAGYKYNPGEATDKIKQDVARNIQSNIQSDIEPNFQEIADEYGITAQEVQDVYNNEIKAGKQGTTIDTAGANVQPAGAFGDIEPETQQLAGVEKDVGLLPKSKNIPHLDKTLNSQTKDRFIAEIMDRYDLDETAAESWYTNYAGPGADQEYTIESALQDFEGIAENSNGTINKISLVQNRQNKQNQGKTTLENLLQETGGDLSGDDLRKIANDYDLSIEEVRNIANEYGNVNDKEVADELGVDEQELAGLLGPNPLKTLGKTYQGAPWEEENIKNILQQAGGDKAKALELLKQQQANYKDKGPILKDQFLPGLIDQAAAGETNLSLPASDPTAEQLAETDSLFENTPEKEMVAAEQLAGQGNAPLSQLTDKIQTKNILSSNESSVEGTLPNGSQFIVTDTGTGLQYQIVNGPDGDEEPLNVGYDEFDTLVDFINNDGKESGQPATFEVADENNLTPDEFQRMDFEAGEAAGNDLVSQNDNAVNLLGELSDEFDDATKRKVLNEYLNKLQESGQEFQGDTFDREEVGKLLQQQSAQLQPLESTNVQEVLNSVNGDVNLAFRIIKGQQAIKGGSQVTDRTIKNNIKKVAETAKAKPAQAPAQQATPQAAATPQPQQQPGKIDRKKLEQAAGDLGVNADLLEGLLELLKKVR